jgi:hypothetical protein
VSRSRLELNFCLFGVKVPGSLGSKVSRCQGAKIKIEFLFIWCQGQGVKVSRLELNFCLYGVKVPRSQGAKVSRYRAVPRFQDVKVPRL